MKENFSVQPPDSLGSVVAGIDVGGTFTDLLLIDGRDGGRVHIAKTPTTVDNQAFGVRFGARRHRRFRSTASTSSCTAPPPPPTPCWSARLAKTGMITTRGFRDVLELGRRTRPQAYGMTGTFEPLIPRELGSKVDERVEASGEVRTPLDEAEMREAVRALIAAGLRIPRHPFPARLRQPGP